MEFDPQMMLQIIGIAAAADKGFGRFLRRVSKKTAPLVSILRLIALNNAR